MKFSFANLLCSVSAVLAVAACSPSKNEAAGAKAAAAPADHSDPIASAMAAAPAAIAKDAAIVSAGSDGSMMTLRAGTNGFTCMPDTPSTPGPDPMCMDANAMVWATAWMAHKPPPAETPGVIYMLAGGTDASNTDPYAEKPSGAGDWVTTGPHMMLVGSAKALAGYPSGTNPNTAQPYVMWAGTPYAHLMLPVS